MNNFLIHLIFRHGINIVKLALADRDQHIAKLEAELSRRPEERYLPNAPHIEKNACPMWYGECLCTVKELIHNIQRAEKAEAEVKRLREACEPLYRTEWPHNIWYIVTAKDEALAEQFARVMHDLHAALASQGDGNDEEKT